MVSVISIRLFASIVAPILHIGCRLALELFSKMSVNCQFVIAFSVFLLTSFGRLLSYDDSRCEWIQYFFFSFGCLIEHVVVEIV